MAFTKPSLAAIDGRTIRVAHPDAPGQPKSSLSASVSATGTTLTLAANTGFANGDWVRLGKPGSERSEAVRINGAVTHGTSLTTTACVFDHPTGTEVEKIQFDQVRFFGNSTNSTSGLTTIDTVDVKWDQPFTTFVVTGTEYNFYFCAFYNSNTTTLSDSYSDGLAATGWTEKTVGALIESALDAAKAERGGKINDRWLFREINDGMRFVSGKLKRWSFLQSFDYVLGTVLKGTYSFSLPSNIEDANSPKSILGIRIGTGDNLEYADKREWEKMLRDVAQTQVRTQASSGATTLEIDNSYDFDDSGSVDIYVSGTKYTVTYTGVTRSATAGVLTGVPASGTGSISVTVPVDTYVWQGASEGTPSHFTVFDGSAYFWPLPDSSNDNMNAYLDFYTSKTSVDSYGDSIEASRYDAIKHWLIWKIRSLTNGEGELNLQDGDYLLFKEIMGDMVRREVSGQKGKWKYKTRNVDSVKVQTPSSN